MHDARGNMLTIAIRARSGALVLLLGLETESRSNLSEGRALGGDGERHGGEEDGELGAEEDLLEVGQERAERRHGHLAHQRRVRLLAQGGRRHAVRRPRVRRAPVRAQPRLPQPAAEVLLAARPGLHQRRCGRIHRRSTEQSRAKAAADVLWCQTRERERGEEQRASRADIYGRLSR
jgi:hypothetical protein